MSTIAMKQSPHARPRTTKKQKDHDKQETVVAPVHKPTSKSTTSLENDCYAKAEDGLIKNKEPRINDFNENYSTTTMVHTPSREISIDSECQINTKILSLIETEMKRDINKHSHFTDSRPQSLSFYEDEKMPEELSGNLELLSPEERKHYKKRKEYLQMDTEERNAYNAIQDLYSQRDNEDILSNSLKKSKSRKKRHGDAEMGIGDSREMMIPKEKKKSKKKKREGSPAQTSTSKRKHKKRDEEYEPKTEITLALDDLQDDVFENDNDFGNNKQSSDKMKKSPRRSDKLYVQKKNKFETTTRKNNMHLNRQSAQDACSLDSYSLANKDLTTSYPLHIAICYQKWWMRISALCHGLLAGLALGHSLYIFCNFKQQDESFLVHYAYYSDIYVGLFFALCVLCIVSVFDRMDIAHYNTVRLNELNKLASFVVLLYLACLAVHLGAASYDDKLSLIAYSDSSPNMTVNVTHGELTTWNNLSLTRTILAFGAWLFLGLGTPDDALHSHLKNMEQYLPHK